MKADNQDTGWRAQPERPRASRPAPPPARRALRLALAGAAIAFGSPAAAQECAEWDVSGRWYITQSNVGSVVFDVSQRGKVVTGKAGWSELVGGEPILGIIQRGKDPAFYKGSVDGTVSGSRFELNVYWPTNRAVGVYVGTIGPRGRIEGTTHDKLAPKNRATWFSDSLMKCARLADQPVRPLGKRPAKKQEIDTSKTTTTGGDLRVAPIQNADRLRVQPGVGDLMLRQRPKAPCTPPKC